MFHFSWGIADVDDCCTGALHLADSGKADRDLLTIDGGSAGGYTTLSCLTFRDAFKAGASNYGISDVTALTTDTHKFESHYVDKLIPEEEYENRSPINYVDQMKCALSLFQGAEDKVGTGFRVSSPKDNFIK